MGVIHITQKKLKLALPKGRMFGNVKQLFVDAGFVISDNGRNYRPYCSDAELEIKILKAQNIAKLVELGAHDVGVTGLDWVSETDADVKELLDLGLDPVSIVAAVPSTTTDAALQKKRIVVASEYQNLTEKFLQEKKLNYIYLRSYGATEVFPPEDADMIIDNTATGRTLDENGLRVYATLMRSSSRLITNRSIMKDGWKKEKVEALVLLLLAVLEARKRVMLEMNVAEANLKGLVKILPCMKSPTIQKLYGDLGYAVKVAVEKGKVPSLIPLIKKKGATDIVEYKFEKVVL